MVILPQCIVGLPQFYSPEDTKNETGCRGFLVLWFDFKWICL